jgi:hypothetical protein
MIRKKVLPCLLPAILLALTLACKKPIPLVVMEEADVHRMSFVTTLNDTIPAKTITVLEINRIIEGVKIKYHDGGERRYFKYGADPERLLTAFREMPFELGNARTDVQLIPTKFEAMMQQRDYKADESEEFWNHDNKNLEAYQCFKGGVKHQVLVHRKTSTIYHRVVYS